MSSDSLSWVPDSRLETIPVHMADWNHDSIIKVRLTDESKMIMVFSSRVLLCFRAAIGYCLENSPRCINTCPPFIHYLEPIIDLLVSLSLSLPLFLPLSLHLKPFSTGWQTLLHIVIRAQTFCSAH